MTERASDLPTLKMVWAWLSEANDRIEDAIVREEMARAGLADKRSEDGPLVEFPPCPICCATVTSYNSELGQGSLIIEFRPCGNKVVQDSDGPAA